MIELIVIAALLAPLSILGTIACLVYIYKAVSE